MIKEIRSKFDMKTINLIHVFITGTLLACIGYKKTVPLNGNSMP